MNIPPNEQLLDHVVRLSIPKQAIGSGFIIESTNPDQLYVLTARHCLRDLPPEQAISIDFYDSRTGEFKPVSVLPTAKLTFPLTDSCDLALLSINRTQIPGLISPLGMLPSIPRQTMGRFIGFPNGLKARHPRDVEVKTALANGDFISLKTTERFQADDTEALDNAKGFSGSGLFYEPNGFPVLIGVITHFNSKFHDLYAIELLRINELTAKYNLSPVQFLPEKPVLATTQSHTDFIINCRHSLKQAENLWMNLQPEEAQTLVSAVHQGIRESTLDEVNRKPLLAQVFYLQGVLNTDLKRNEDSTGAYLKAYSFHKEKITYKERAATSYLVKGNAEMAEQLAEQILAEDEENARAWLVIQQLRPDWNLPAIVLAKPTYKIGRIAVLQQTKSGPDYQTLKSIFADELIRRPVPSLLQIDRTNLYYWFYLAQTAMLDAFFSSGQRIGMQKPAALVANELLSYASELLTLLCDRVHRTAYEDDPHFQVARFDYCYCQYFLTTDPNLITESVGRLYRLFLGADAGQRPRFWAVRERIIEHRPDQLLQLVAIFLQQNQPQRVIKAIEQAGEVVDPEVYFLEAISYTQLGEADLARKVYYKYVEYIQVIDQHTAINFLAVGDELLRAGVSPDELMPEMTDGKTIESAFIQPLLIAYLRRFQEARHPEIRELAEQVRPFWPELHRELQKALAQVYVHLKDWNTAKQLWKELIEDETRESAELRSYLLVLNEEFTEYDELRERFAYWRANFTPDLALVHRELSIYRNLEDHTRQVEVATYALHHFPDSIQFWLDCIAGLHRLERHDDLVPLLDERIFSPELPTQARLVAAHIYLVHNKPETGLEAIYRELKANPENTGLKLKYLSLFSLFRKLVPKITVDKVAQDTVIAVSANGQTQWLEITHENLLHNPIAKAAVGLLNQETFVLENSLSGTPVVYTIDNVLEKYEGYSVLIYQDLERNPHHGASFQIIDLPKTDDIDQQLKRMEEAVGPGERLRHQQAEEGKLEFSRRKYGFFELSLQSFSANPGGAWQHATHTGFPITALVQFQSRLSTIPLSDKLEFVLDFSSLLTLYHLPKPSNLGFRGKPFRVSQYTIDYVASELELAQVTQLSPITLGYQNDKFGPIFYPEDIQQHRLVFWSNLRDWISQHCQPDYAWERLTIQREWDGFKELFSSKTQYESSFYDTILLALKPNRILLTDDSMFFVKPEFTVIRRATTEWFLRTVHTNRYKESLWQALIRFNMQGLQITGNQLFLLWKQEQNGQPDGTLFPRALASFSLEHNPDFNHFMEAINFLKQALVWIDNMHGKEGRQQKETLVELIFTTLFTNLKNWPEGWENALRNYIDIEFSGEKLQLLKRLFNHWNARIKADGRL